LRWSPFLLTLLGCSSGLEEPSRRAEAVIVGDDDRVEAFTLAADVSAAASSAVALGYAHRLSWPVSGGVEIQAPSLGEVHGLCADEAFATQPALAFCSGVLIDDNLVMTSGHCLAEEPLTFCRQTLVAFGYAYAAVDQPIELSADDVFACRRVLSWQTEELDYAVIELDRPTSRTPVTLADRRVAVGDRVTVASYPSGLPLKCETGALVVETEADASSFTAATDTFGGSSGGPIFDEALGWVGMVDSGAPDWVGEQDCTRATRSDTSREVHQHASAIVEALCGAGLPSARLCGVASTCGDGHCGGQETPAGCAKDCPLAECGDGVCEVAERTVCSQDCARYARVPPDFPDAPEKYLKWHPTEAAPEGATGCQLSSVAQRTRPAWLVWLAVAGVVLLRRNATRAVEIEYWWRRSRRGVGCS
jgi:V8-like Glu-specific endopeptidase